MNWLLIVGLGMAWLGWQIVWVAPLPRQLRRAPVGGAAAGDAPPRDDRKAFMRFWLDQYAWLGLTLLALGLAAALAGALRAAPS